jgi:PhoD-like phosphatase, N-terminal domain
MMTQQRVRFQRFRRTVLTIGLAALGAMFTASAEAAVSFLGVVAGDASSTNATLWTRATPGGTTLALDIATDQAFAPAVRLNNACTTDAAKDFTCKRDVTGLVPNTVYYYRFVEPFGEMSIVGRFKTAPAPNAAVPVHFAFSGDNDGLMRPYALATVIPSKNLDFYINLGDVIYENGSNVSGSNGASYLNSPSVTLSNDSLSFNGVPRAFIPGAAPFATQAQLFADYSKKYRENFLPVNTGGQNGLQVLYAAQGNYTTWDNHELGNRKYIDGGAPAGGSVGGPAGTDMATGRGVDARLVGTCNPGCANDVNTSTTDFMNRSTGFLTLEQVFLNYQPIANRARSMRRAIRALMARRSSTARSSGGGTPSTSTRIPGPIATSASRRPTPVRTTRPLPAPTTRSALMSEGVLDRCGMTLLAGKAVGAPFVGSIAATLALAEVLRLLHGGWVHQLIDLDLLSLDQRQAVRHPGDFGALNPGFVSAASSGT